MVDTPAPATAHDVVEKLLSLIEGAAKLSPAARTHLDLIGKIVGGLGDEFAEVILAKYDVPELFAAIVEVEDAAISLEDAGRRFSEILSRKKTPAPTVETATEAPAETPSEGNASTVEAPATTFHPYS